MKHRTWVTVLVGVGIAGTLVFVLLLWRGIERLGAPPLLRQAEALVGMPESKVIENLGPPFRVLTREQILSKPDSFPGETYKGNLSVPKERVLEYHVPVGKIYLYIEKGRLVKIGSAWT